MHTIVYINGKFCESSVATIDFYDSGFMFGYGLFETIRFNKNTLFKIDDHLNRLFQGLKQIQLKTGYSKNFIIDCIMQLINKNNMESGLAKIIITRGRTEDFNLNENYTPSLFISLKKLPKIDKSPINIKFLSESNYPLIRFKNSVKSLNYLGNILAKLDSDKDAFEPVFYNENGIVTECAFRNIFFIKNNCLYTPSTDLGILPGIMRETIIEITRKMNINISFDSILYKTIDSMEEAFISSTGIGLLPCYWENWNSKTNYQLTQKIEQHLREFLP